ncbi:hypothetical protein B0H17DRAFT_1085380 [Mycena rosella]|uniref:Uncharacterized protein n=1 Tax=Mycena rosella TaxID=1033263 RepID=A0AAD7D0M1_MYCRO|nr:hypothetical protein B0H17DRAFT_1085380 [Mycena rosella]
MGGEGCRGAPGRPISQLRSELADSAGIVRDKTGKGGVTIGRGVQEAGRVRKANQEKGPKRTRAGKIGGVML